MKSREIAADLLRSLQATAASNAGWEPSYTPLGEAPLLVERHTELLARLAGLDLPSIVGATLPIFEREIFLGSMNSVRANGYTYQIPNGQNSTEPEPPSDFLIVLNSGLFNVLNLALKSLWLFMSSFSETSNDLRLGVGALRDRDEFSERLRTVRAPVAEERFADLIISYTRFGDPGLAMPYPTVRPGSKWPYYLSQLHFAERFVLAHDYGHIAKGSAGPVMIWEIGMARPVRPEDRHPEHTADDVGFRLTIAHAIRSFTDGKWAWPQDGGDPLVAIARAWAGVELVFNTMDIVDRAVSMLATGDEFAVRDTSYPTPGQRRQYLLDRCEDSGGSTFVRGMVDSSMTDIVLQELWRRIRPSIRSLHERGVRPAVGMLPSEVSHLGDPSAPVVSFGYPLLTALECWTSSNESRRKLGAEVLFGLDFQGFKESLVGLMMHGDDRVFRTLTSFLSTIDSTIDTTVGNAADNDFESRWALLSSALFELTEERLRASAISTDPTLQNAVRLSDLTAP